MNTRLVSLVAAIVLLLPLTVFAKNNNVRSVNISQPVQVGATELKPGTYQVEWNGQDPEVQVNFMQHNKTVATAQGKMIEKPKPSPYDDVVTKPIADNSQQKTIDEIDFRHQKEALLILPNQNNK